LTYINFLDGPNLRLRVGLIAIEFKTAFLFEESKRRAAVIEVSMTSAKVSGASALLASVGCIAAMFLATITKPA